MLYLYALVEGVAALDDVRGAAGEPLQCLTVESLCVVAGELPGLPPIDRAALTAQDRVVRDLHHRAAALLPMRFGTAYPSPDEARRAIATRAPALNDALALVRHREQMTIRILGARGARGAIASPSEPLGRRAPLAPLAPLAVAPGMTGREYLEGRAASRMPREIVPLLEALSGVQRATKVEASRTPGLVATVYQLIDRGASGAYVTQANAAAGLLEGHSLRISGPAPCYAFAEI
jgi:hypothetical protein